MRCLLEAGNCVLGLLVALPSTVSGTAGAVWWRRLLAAGRMSTAVFDSRLTASRFVLFR